MRRAAAALCAVAAAAAPAGAAGPAWEPALRRALQDLADRAAAYLGPGTAFSIAYKTAEVEISVAGGGYNATSTTPPRAASADDIFLIGSGSKTYTAAAVLRLVEQGKVRLSDPVSRHIDPLIAQLRPGASWAGIFGASHDGVTVDDLLRMRSGIPDYDFDAFNDLLLVNQSMRAHSLLEYFDVAASTPADNPGRFPPGNGTWYSSTNYVALGMLLAVHSGGGWAAMRQSEFFPAEVAAGLTHTRFVNTGPIRDGVSAPGRSCAFAYTPEICPQMWDQDATILGYTASNVATTTAESARWIWDLNGPGGRVLRPETLELMTAGFPVLQWFPTAPPVPASCELDCNIRYGRGLMVGSEAYDHNLYSPGPAPDRWGSFVGHGGYVFGYHSVQGMWWPLNASMAVMTNNHPMVAPPGSPGGSDDVACYALKAAATAIGVTPELSCRPVPGLFSASA